MVIFMKNIMVTAMIMANGITMRPPVQWTLESPNRTLSITVMLQQAQKDSASGRLAYSVSLAGESRPAILPSPLGLCREDQDFSRGLIFVKAGEVQTIDQSYTMLTGKQRSLRDHCREQTLTFRNPQGGRLELLLRAYDDGVAFRYRFPETEPAQRAITAELTGFQLPLDGAAFTQPYDQVATYAPAYEAYYGNALPVGTRAPYDMGWCFPALFRVPSGWLLITEAGLDGTYCGCRLEQNADDGLYRLRFPDAREGNGTGEVTPRSSLPWSTPWRVIIAAKQLSSILESNLVSHLNPPSVLNDVDWIKPGRVAWSWWSDQESPKNPQAQRAFIDLAGRMSWEYCLIDANWNEMPAGAIPDLVEYGRAKGVGLLLWYNSGGPHNSVTEAPRDRMQEREIRRKEMQWLAEIGVKGVKVDFFQSDKQNVIRHYLDILNDAADFHLMVNFHGCTVPRGWQRTFPHLISMEAVRGSENYLADPAFPSHAPWHNTILAFTRNVVGSMDYTPVAFSDARYPHFTTYGHELALPVIFESGWLHFADKPAVYSALPDVAQDYLRRIPVVWDETRLLAGEPGKFVFLARRHGEDWYLGAINGLETVQTIEGSLSLLSEGRYQAVEIRDAEQPGKLTAGTRQIDKNETIRITLPPFGGYVLLAKRLKN